MADKKISALIGATTPLAGTEVLPIVQGGATVKVSIANLTDGRLVSSAGVSSSDTVGLSPQKAIGSGNGYAGNTSAFSYGNLTLYDNDGASVINCQTNLSGAGVKIQTVGVTRLWARNTGDIDFSTGNLIQGTAAKGVNFTANTPAAGMTSQLLNWYEEGTWTPTGNGITFSSATGSYTRVGNLVTVAFYVVFPTTTNSNNAQIQGLPFVPTALSAVALGAFTTDLSCQISASSSFMYFTNTDVTAFKLNVDLSAKSITGFATYQV